MIYQAHGGVGLKHVTKGMVENLKFILPEKKEQNEFCDRLDLINHIIKKNNKFLNSHKESFSSIEKKFFSLN